MIDVPPEVAIRSTIKPGSVYYFSEDSLHSSEPHYFIVINKDPFGERVVLLVCASSRIDKVKQRRRTYPVDTLVEITSLQYKDFKVNSIVDCNYLLEKTIDQLIDKLTHKKLWLKTEMDFALVKRLREGVLASPLIERRIKALLRG